MLAIKYKIIELVLLSWLQNKLITFMMHVGISRIEWYDVQIGKVIGLTSDARL